MYIGIVSTAGAFYLWNKGMEIVDAGSGGLFFFFQPLAGTLLGWLFLGEHVGIIFWVGATLILIGVLLVAKEPSAVAGSSGQDIKYPVSIKQRDAGIDIRVGEGSQG